MDVKLGLCDIYEGEHDGDKIPEGGVIYTSYAMCYREELDSKFVDFISSCKPKLVIHFEPVYEHLNDKNLFDLLCKQYIKKNGYNLNLLTILQEMQSRKKIKILSEKKHVYGMNPLLPISVIMWKPE